MTNETLRRATLDDVDAVEALVQAAYGPWVEVIGAVPGPMQDDYAPAIDEGVVQVMDDAEGVVALLILRPREDSLLLENIAVAPRAQGTGLGRRLMAEADRVARAQGLPRIILYTHAKMAANIAIYERAGFVQVEERHERGLHRVYMEKSLSQN